MRRHDINRRQFIQTTSLGLCSAGLGLPLLSGCRSEESGSHKVVYRTLGKTGLRFSIVSFGVMNTDSPDMLNRALEQGINHFDTAHVYLRGNSERVIGEVLETTGKRKDVYVATKMRFARDREKHVFLPGGSEREPGATEENFNEQLDTSLRRLRCDYVDILYIHSCYSPEMAVYEPLLKALVKAKESGKARFVGVTTHNNEPDVIRAAVDTGVVEVIETAYHFMHEKREELAGAIQYAADNGVGIIAMKTQGGGRLSEEVKARINHKAALKWVLNNKNVCAAIPGMTAFDQLESNLQVMSDLTISEEEKASLQMSSAAKGSFYCQNCRVCIPSCPRRVEIPTIMRAYMYAEGYGNLVQAETTLGGLSATRGLGACRSCSECTASCHAGIDIPRRLRTLSENGLWRV